MRSSLFHAMLLACASSGCATLAPDRMAESLPAAEGTPVGLGKAVEVGLFAAEPLEIVEDSRCPVDAQCVWRGRLIVRTALAHDTRSDVMDLTLGEPVTWEGAQIVLASATPDKRSEDAIDPSDYRFVYERR